MRHDIFTDLSSIDREVIRGFRFILYAVFKDNPPKTKDDLDILSYRLFGVLKEACAMKIYEETIKCWRISPQAERKAKRS